jgi:hypothetical protein
MVNVPFHVKHSGFPLDSPHPCWYDRGNEWFAHLSHPRHLLAPRTG